MKDIRRILVVCTGNSCRSPMAEGFLKKYLKSEDGYEVISAGTLGLSGSPPTREAVEAMLEEGIDISLYFSTPFSMALADSADIILVMANVHKEFILEKAPEVKNKVYLLKEFAGTGGSDNEIPDPIGQSSAIYHKVRDEIKEASLGVVRKIKGDLRE